MSASVLKPLVSACLVAAALTGCNANAPTPNEQAPSQAPSGAPHGNALQDESTPEGALREQEATRAAEDGQLGSPDRLQDMAPDEAPEPEQMPPAADRDEASAVAQGSAGSAAALGGAGRAAAATAPRRIRQAVNPSAPTRQPNVALPPGENFEDYGENDWTLASEDALETFSIDVDTASYAITRRDLNAARLPAPASVRVEEFVNAFDYQYEGPADTDTPFALHLEAAESEFGDGMHLLRVGIQGFETDPADRAPANLVFLVDTSGSMRSADKLGLVKYALGALLQSLGPDDTLSIVSYGGRAQIILPTTRVMDRSTILDAINGLQAGGGTNGAEGIRTAYEVARAALRPGGTNRVIWCSDGDLNVGMTGDELLGFIEENGRQGVALTTLGFGRGNLNDRDLERFANRGDGNYYYIGDRNEALRVLGEEVMSTLEIIARDVKIQVEVNPDVVESYRLIGYENRAVADQDFRNDAVDAGEIGSGHSVTALLELRLHDERVLTRAERLATVRVRYELPNEEGEGREVERSLLTNQIGASFDAASPSFRQAAAVAEFAEVLRGGENTASDLDAVLAALDSARRPGDLQALELATLITQARSLRR